jgi:excisionase family DNA binding protein
VDESETRRVTVEEAAQLLGIEKGSVKKRIQRGKLRSEKDANGTLYVYVDRSETVQDNPETVQDKSQGQGQDSESGALMSEMRGRIEDLRDQLEAERQAHSEARRLLAAALERIPAIEAPASPEARESPETSSEPSEGAEPHPVTGEAEEGVRRPWWQRWFRG